MTQELTPLDFAGLLAILGYDGTEQTALMTLVKGQKRTLIGPLDKLIETALEGADFDLWFNVNPTSRRGVGRGTSAEATRLAALVCELDDAKMSRSAADAAIAEIAEVLGWPSAVLESGHGRHFYWPIRRDDTLSNVAAAVLSARFGILVKMAASKRPGTVDTVSDLARMLRVPGSTNRKAEPVPVLGFRDPRGIPLRVADVVAALDAKKVPVVDESDAARDVVSPPSGWGYAAERVEVPCRWLRTKADAWLTDSVGQRHGWLLSQAVKLHCAHRHGCVGSDDQLAGLIAELRAAFLARLAGAPARMPDPPNEFEAAFAEGERLAACKTDDELLAEIGGEHHHDRQCDGEQNMEDTDTKTAAVEPITLTQCHDVFTKWLGTNYDTDALDAVLAAAAIEQLDGDPLWLMLISGPGYAKTETVQALSGVGATVTSTIQSEGGLLSASANRDKTKGATGGLLRKMGDRGVLVIKDVTSILSMDRTMRGQVLAALREVYDGRWERNVGTDGGKTLTWTGRLVVIGACTTVWDTAHAVIAACGDRFVLCRMDSALHRIAAGDMAMSNIGSEVDMRAELAAAVSGVLAGVDGPPTLTKTEQCELLLAADLVTRVRTGVEFDYRGNVDMAHAPEAPTRFAKQLAQLARGAIALGIDRRAAVNLAIRCARDSMPPLRLQIIDDLAAAPGSTPSDVRRRIDQPWTTVDRQLQALHLLHIVTVFESEALTERGKTRWYYSLAADVNPDAIKPKVSPEMLLREI